MSVTALQWVTRGLHREVVVGRRAVAALGVGAMVVCLSLAGAYARYYGPWSPVPITLQTFFVLVAGAGMGTGLGTLSTSAYVALGACGLPVFAGNWRGDTTGYLVGFAAAAALIGAVCRRSPRPSTGRIALAMLAGTLVIYGLGAAYLAHYYGYGPWLAVTKGVLPFLKGDALKLAAAVAFCRGYRERLRALFP
jgi:biotin transport system substrate-specific component